MTDVFISYRRLQRARVEHMAQALRDLELDVWFDRELTPGLEFPAEIARAANACKAMIVCWTPESTESNWVLREARIGLDRRVLAPVFFERCLLPFEFSDVQTVDLTDWRALDDDTWLDLLRRVGALVGRDTLPDASRALANGRRDELVARVRRRLVSVARSESIAFYVDLAREMGVDQPTLWAALDAISAENRARREPPLSALVIGEKSGLPGRGYFQKHCFLAADADPLAAAIWARHRDRVWEFEWPPE